MKKKNKPLKIIFAGTPRFSAKHLQKIISENYTVLGVLTKPDHINKKKRMVITSPIKEIAQKNNIPVFQPHNINNIKNYYNILQLKADVMIVIAYGLILPEALLAAFPMGCINLHASLLPRWRGAAPIQWAILNGDKNTGISIIQMEKKIDAGKILYQIPCNISPTDTTNSLLDKLCKIGTKAILHVLKNINNKTLTTQKQNKSQVTYATKLLKNMGKINFSENAKVIERMIRAFTPWPGTYIDINNSIIKIHQAEILLSEKKYKIGQIITINKQGIQVQTSKNILNIKKIQIPGKKITTVSQFIQTNHQIFKTNQIL